MIYQWLVDLVGLPTGANDVIIMLSGFFVCMTFIIGIELLIYGFRAIFYK